MNAKAVEAIYFLSPMQQGMLFHSLLAPESGAYIVQMTYQIRGALNSLTFEEAWQKLCDRHPIFRTAFVWENLEKPLQVVGRKVKLPVEQLDWTNFSINQQSENLTELLQEQRQQGFNLSHAPLIKITLIKLEKDHYQVIWTHHHLLLDGWSVGCIFKEFLAYYQVFSLGKTIDLPIPTPYRDYISWLQKQDRTNAEKYWKKTLKGFISPTPLGIDKPTPNFRKASPQYNEKQKHLSRELTSALQKLAKEKQLTLNTLIQGVLSLVLSCYSGESDIVFGATVSGRPPKMSDAESMIGLFINTLPVRVKINPQQSLLSWLKQLQNKQIEQQEYEYTPLLEIQQHSDVSGNFPLFENLVIFENYPVEPTLKKSLQGLEINNIQTTEQTNYPLTLYVTVRSQLTLRVLYDSDRFSSSSIDRFLEHLETLLTSISENPEQQLWEISLLTNQEQKELLIEGKREEEKNNSNICIHQLFEAQVEKIPNNTAVIFEEESLTYQELNKKANQLAHYLHKLGIKAETLVGICLESSLEMVIALLAIIKVGGAYLSLDSNYPQQRLDFIIQDSEIDYLIGSSASKNNNSNTVKYFIDIDKIQAEINQQKNTNLELEINPENLAYIIYTSGSTGIPKGVQVPHSCLSNFLLSMKEKPGLTDKDTLLSVTTLSFDIAALELYLPLTVGAKLILVSRDVTVEGVTLAQQLLTQKVTVMQATPATWKLLLASGWEGKKDLTILCGGEALSPDLAEQLKEKSKQVFNLYGPTETTIWSSVYEVETEKVRLGKPINNTQLYILDKDYNQLPIGVPGELYIGGKGVTRGYLKRPELTAERFIANPFKAGERLYKTGDLVKYGEDREIEYIGRIDYQVKLRGYRLELGEIETILLNHPQIKEAVVIVKEESLIAYIVCQEEININPRSIKEYIGERLPSYMIPSRFVELEKLPLTPNGKINRKALPEPNDRQQLTETYVSPRSEIERTIAKIWQEVLKIETIGINDPFFDLGGHSLSMVRVHSKVREAFSSDISLVEMFQYPTISDLAAYFERQKSKKPAFEPSQPRNERLTAGKERLKQRRQKNKKS
ncbi:amino acid adenylation domain-containing protein [Crocosphaera sp. Alani8]|uniref:amino acid adenylation domain-containing protein n=1 Tax=Crocosphaera sp. Alani8 TaxID=3038952 RepID=UPI00313C064B